jgi:hypothetical protein
VRRCGATRAWPGGRWRCSVAARLRAEQPQIPRLVLMTAHQSPGSSPGRSWCRRGPDRHLRAAEEAHRGARRSTARHSTPAVQRLSTATVLVTGAGRG